MTIQPLLNFNNETGYSGWFGYQLNQSSDYELVCRAQQGLPWCSVRLRPELRGLGPFRALRIEACGLAFGILLI